MIKKAATKYLDTQGISTKAFLSRRPIASTIGPPKPMFAATKG